MTYINMTSRYLCCKSNITKCNKFCSDADALRHAYVEAVSNSEGDDLICDESGPYSKNIS